MSWVGELERAGQEEKLSSNVIFIVRCELRYGYPMQDGGQQDRAKTFATRV